MLFSNILTWMTAFSFPYEIIPSFLLAADCGLMCFFPLLSFFFFFSHTFLIFPKTGLAEPRGGSRGEVQSAARARRAFQTSCARMKGFLFCQAEINKRLGFTLMGEKEIVPTPLCILEITEFFLQQKSAGDSFNPNKSFAGRRSGGGMAAASRQPSGNATTVGSEVVRLQACCV